MTIKRVEFNSAGFRAVLRSSGALGLTASMARKIAGRAGDGFEARSSMGNNRARSVVIATTREAMVAEAEDKALTRALGGR
ncbi:MAG: hypothetical protein Q4G35_03260 [Propionibacteriaceae bacterium]|nr:hypothetical protein [Propionibacteriaceae bacterium]